MPFIIGYFVSVVEQPFFLLHMFLDFVAAFMMCCIFCHYLPLLHPGHAYRMVAVHVMCYCYHSNNQGKLSWTLGVGVFHVTLAAWHGIGTQ